MRESRGSSNRWIKNFLCPRTIHSLNFVEQIPNLDLVTYMPVNISTKVDRDNMAVSLEARVPLLDYRLVEFVLYIASES